MTGLLPVADIAIDLNAATFAVPGSKRSAVALAVGVDALVDSLGAAAIKQRVPLEVFASAFDRGGRPKGAARQTIDLSWPQGESTVDRRFDVLSRLDLLPGDYELRIAISGGEPRRTASVYTYTTVPAFETAPLALSDIVFGATSHTLTAPKDFLSAVLPIVPTTRREFVATDKLVGFLRIYQGTNRREPLTSVQVRSSLVNAQGEVVAAELRTLTVAEFEKDRTADYYLALPLATLAPGEYLLRVEVDMGARTAGRAVRFRLRS